jgi:hypothetical protein
MRKTFLSLNLTLTHLMTTGDAELPVPYNITLAPKGKIMNDGVKILLERMQTHPEEFFDESSRLHVTSKWGKLIADHQDFLEPEDKNALNDGLKKLHRQIFTEKVLEELVDPKKSSLEELLIAKRNATPSVGQTPMPSTITLEHTEHLRAHLDALQQEYANVFKETKKPHKTLFGRLFNYQ